MRRNIIIISCVLVLAFVLGLSGFTLAGPENESGGRDRLIGVYATPEHVDLFDFEGYFNDNADKIMSGGAITGGSKYEGRLYAELRDKVLTNEETGEQTAMQEYVFPDLEGVAFFAATIGEGEESYTGTASDKAVSSGGLRLSCTDEGESIEMSGTIYVTPGSDNNAWYFNPVYQSADGRVYLVSGDGISCGGVMDEGAVMSQTLSDTAAVTQNGVTETYSCSIELAIEFRYAPESFSLLQMAADGKCLSAVDYAHD